MQLRSLLALALLPASLAAVLRPKLPHRFTAKLEVTTKHLNRTNVYPPAWRTIDVEYDWPGRRARAYVHTSYEKRQKTNGTTTIRRYDLGKEWEISQFGKVMVCKWCRTGRNRQGVQGAHLNPLGLFLERSGPHFTHFHTVYIA